MATRYIENETGIEVLLDGDTFQWGVHPPQHFVVRYPDGRVYITPIEAVMRHFTLVTPQTIEIGKVIPGGIDRPTQEQRELDAELDSGNSSTGH